MPNMVNFQTLFLHQNDFHIVFDLLNLNVLLFTEIGVFALKTQIFKLALDRLLNGYSRYCNNSFRNVYIYICRRFIILEKSAYLVMSYVMYCIWFEACHVNFGRIQFLAPISGCCNRNLKKKGSGSTAVSLEKLNCQFNEEQ